MHFVKLVSKIGILTHTRIKLALSVNYNFAAARLLVKIFGSFAKNFYSKGRTSSQFYKSVCDGIRQKRKLWEQKVPLKNKIKYMRLILKTRMIFRLHMEKVTHFHWEH